MKFGAVYCLYDDHEYLEISLEPIKKHLDKVLFLISSVPWNGSKTDNSATIQKVEQLCKDNKNFELVKGGWKNEIDQRNFGLSRFLIEGINICFIIDNDEVYHEKHFRNIIEFIEQNSQYDAFHIEWNTYWKKDYYRIHPREEFRPVIAVRVKNFHFTIIRGGITSIIRTEQAVLKLPSSNYNGILISPNIAICYHLSYARDDECMKRKFETNSHAPEFIKNWYDEIWLKWNPQMRNLHPVTSSQYQIAVKEDFSIFPDSLKKFIKRERLPKRKCSIIILNWNSGELLDLCLKLVLLRTQWLIDIIIIDNGSKDEKSIEVLKSLEDKFKIIYNKENLGFAKAVNQGIKIADRNSDICLLNVDAEVQEDWLTNMYETMMSIPDSGMVGPLGNEVASGHQCEGYVDKDTKVPNLYGYCLLILRELIDKIGIFDEQYCIGGYEDNDYGVRAKLAGYELYISSKSLVKHKAHQVYKINNVDHYKNDDINREKYLNKFFGVLLEYGRVHDFYKLKNLAKGLRLKI